MSIKSMIHILLRNLLFVGALSLAACASAPVESPQTRALTTLGFSKVDDGWKLILPDRVSFEFDKVTLKPELQDSIANVARQLLSVDIRQVRVEGYTDNVGMRDYNLNLSRRRADIVAAVLVKEGFSAANVDSKGYGSERPIGDNSTEAGRAENRRVEIIVLSAMLAPPERSGAEALHGKLAEFIRLHLAVAGHLHLVFVQHQEAPGTPSEPLRVAFVQSCWHRDIVDRCRDGFDEEMKKLGYSADQLEYFEVPGAFELPLQTRLLAKTGRYAAVLAAGLVVDGGIYRHDFVATAVIDGLMRNQLDLEVPMLSAVLTPHHFHEHEEHQRYFSQHFVVKGTELARACDSVIKANAQVSQIAKAA